MTTSLHDAFLTDHKQLTRGLSAILRALRAGDTERAFRLASELDEAVGPHMQFEEEVFYPEVEKILGREFVDQLYAEHALGQRAIRSILAHGQRGELAGEIETLIRDLETTLQHAFSCGTLLSHLDALPADETATLLRKLQELRSSEIHWSMLPERRPPSGRHDRANGTGGN